VLRLVDWLPNALSQTNQPKHITPFLLRITYDSASLLYSRSSAEIVTSRTPSSEIITSRTILSGDNNFTDAGQLVRCHDNDVTL
jgi:hypothetical protein